MAKGKKRSQKNKTFSDRIRKNPKVLFFLLVMSGILLIASTYAWFSASLNVQVKFFNVKVSSHHGLFISLDGINFDDHVDLTVDTVIHDLKSTYPHHTNQWAMGGLWPVSSLGIRDSNQDKFDVFVGSVHKKSRKEPKVKLLSTKLVTEHRANQNNSYITFDIFLKNVTGSPFPDNIYFNEDTIIEFDEEVDEELEASMSNLLNSVRFGLVKIGSLPHESDPLSIQNIGCNGGCTSLIYEPNSLFHSEKSINYARDFGIELVDGIYRDTYGIHREGIRLEHFNGQEGSGIPLDTRHFRLQETMTDFSEALFEIPNGITKLRAYVWVEGQDMDSIETLSDGAPLFIYVNFEKDQAGYQ